MLTRLICAFIAVNVFGVAGLVPYTSALAHDEHTSEWNYIDERWPSHAGALVETKDPDAYLKQILVNESTKIQSWFGRTGVQAMDSVVACGVRFTGYIRQRPKGTYLLLVISSADEKSHSLKWIPMEYRFDNEPPQELYKRIGSPDLTAKNPHFYESDQQQEYLRQRHDSPDVRKDPELKNVYKDEFRKGDRSHPVPRAAGANDVNPRFRALEALKFPKPKQFTSHDNMQIYLPWIDDCDVKPALLFQHTGEKEVVWDSHMRSWVSVGGQQMVVHSGGWSVIRPTPSFYIRFLHPIWNHHEFSVETHLAFVKGSNADGTAVIGALQRVSYAYAYWPTANLTLTPEFGYRGVLGVQGFLISGLGGGVNLAWEVPGTRHQHSGQRLVFESGCDFEYHATNIQINGQAMRGSWGNCKIGLGLGW